MSAPTNHDISIKTNSQLDDSYTFSSTDEEWEDIVQILRNRVAGLLKDKRLLKNKNTPVAYLHQVVCEAGEPDQALSFYNDSFPLEGVAGYKSIMSQPLYTAPPSIDALIAEIDGLERIDFDEGGCYYPCSDGDNYRFDDVRAVLNKYRGAK